MNTDHLFIERARLAVEKAERDLAAVMRARFPMGTPVQVDGGRTRYSVVGYDSRRLKIMVRPEGKFAYWATHYEKVTKL